MAYFYISNEKLVDILGTWTVVEVSGIRVISEACGWTLGLTIVKLRLGSGTQAHSGLVTQAQ